MRAGVGRGVGLNPNAILVGGSGPTWLSWCVGKVWITCITVEPKGAGVLAPLSLLSFSVSRWRLTMMSHRCLQSDENRPQEQNHFPQPAPQSRPAMIYRCLPFSPCPPQPKQKQKAGCPIRTAKHTSRLLRAMCRCLKW